MQVVLTNTQEAMIDGECADVAAVFCWLLNFAEMTEFNPLVEAESCTVV